MCYTEGNGSSFWFMTASSAAAKASAFLRSLGHELDHENYVASLAEFAKAPFDVFIAEQKLGDLVLVPKRSCHQVVNAGGLTVKTSWSRMTVDGLVSAFHHELPIYRRVCREETYRVKLLIHRALKRYTARLESSLPGQNSASNNSDEGGHSWASSTPSVQLRSVASPESSARIVALDGPRADQRHSLEKTSEDITNLRKLLNLFDKVLKEEHAG